MRYEGNKHTKLFKLCLCNYARVCKEHELELELEKNDWRLKYLEVKRSTLKGCRRTVTLPIKPNFTTRIVHNLNILVL